MQATRGTSLSSTDPAESSSSPASRYRLLFALVAVAAYAVDLGTKLLAVAHLTPHERVDVVGGLLRLDLVRNPGAAFSTGTSYTLILSVIALIAAGVVDPLRPPARRPHLGGGPGAPARRRLRQPDRPHLPGAGVLRGHVVDFLELPHWPVFNVADMLIDAAVILIIIQTWRGIGITGARHSRP